MENRLLIENRSTLFLCVAIELCRQADALENKRAKTGLKTGVFYSPVSTAGFCKTAGNAQQMELGFAAAHFYKKDKKALRK